MTTTDGKPKVGEGIFAHADRDPEVIMEAQVAFIGALSHKLKKLDNYGLTKIPSLLDLVAQMVHLDPKARISPQDIIGHEFCKSFGTYATGKTIIWKGPKTDNFWMFDRNYNSNLLLYYTNVTFLCRIRIDNWYR